MVQKRRDAGEDKSDGRILSLKSRQRLNLLRSILTSFGL